MLLFTLGIALSSNGSTRFDDRRIFCRGESGSLSGALHDCVCLEGVDRLEPVVSPGCCVSKEEELRLKEEPGCCTAPKDDEGWMGRCNPTGSDVDCSDVLLVLYGERKLPADVFEPAGDAALPENMLLNDVL